MHLRSILPPLLALASATTAHAGTVTISGNVYDGNGGPLLKGNVYHVLGQVVVPAGTTLSIEEGTVVKFSAGCGFTVDGILDAQGTDSERIIFSSIKDDQAGGDTNQDGSASSPKPADWRGLYFGVASDGSIVTYADLRWGGTATNSGAIELKDTVIVLDHLLVSDCSWTGLNLDESNSTNDATVTNCDFVRCDRPIGGVALDSLQKLLNNTSTDCLNGDFARMIGNDNTFHFDADLSAANLVNGVLVGGFAVPDGVTVTLRDGLVVKPGGPAAFTWISVAGRLELLGQPGNEVVFTSFHDDAYGGDTDDNGSAIGPAPGDWYNVFIGDIFAKNETLLAEHARFRYGGQSGSALLDLSGRADATVRDCVVEQGQRHGIRLGGIAAPLVMERCAVDGNGGIAIVEGVLPLLPTLSEVTASGNTLGDYLQITTSSFNTASSVTFGPDNYPGPALVVKTGFDWPSGKTLELLPGTLVKFDGAQRIAANSGTFRFLGTADRPVVLTSLRDDAIGGDTNQDGTTTSPAPGDWDGVTLALNSGSSVLEHVVLRYGGSTSPQLLCRAAAATVRSLRSEFSKSAAIQADAHAGDARNWVAVAGQKNGIELNGGSFHLRNATAAGNVLVGIKRVAGWTGQVRSSIAWGNAGGNLSGFSGSELFYSDGGFAGSQGNVDVDPLFVDPANGDWRLQPGSPCIETGDPADAAAGSDAAGLPRVLDRDFDRTMRIDMGAFEAGHVTLAVDGDFTPGGTVTLTSDGTPGIPALMFIGFAEADVLFKPYGRLFVDLTQPYLLLPWLPSPASVSDALPTSLPTPLLVLFQEVVVSGRSGNLSNVARMLIE